MKRLSLDFRREARAVPWLGRVLLGVAIAVCVDAGLAYKSLRDSVVQNEIRVAKRTPSGPAAKVSAQEVAAVRESVQRLSAPWDELFLALESAATDKVALAAIEPDTAKGTVTITADGKDYLAALSYVSNLSRIEGLERVELVRHERKHPDPNSPVSFAVTAAWSTK
jgi:hypothetical protein